SAHDFPRGWIGGRLVFGTAIHQCGLGGNTAELNKNGCLHRSRSALPLIEAQRHATPALSVLVVHHQVLLPVPFVNRSDHGFLLRPSQVAQKVLRRLCPHTRRRVGRSRPWRSCAIVRTYHCKPEAVWVSWP